MQASVYRLCKADFSGGLMWLRADVPFDILLPFHIRVALCSHVR